MNRDQLDVRNTAVIRRHWRTLMDNGGQPSPELLAELADIAQQYAVTSGEAFAAVTGYKIGDDIYHPADVLVMVRPVGLNLPTIRNGGGGGEDDAPPLAVTPGTTESRTVPAEPVQAADTPPAGPPPRPRTRTRTQGGAK